MISFEKGLALLKEKGYNTNKIRKEKIISESTLQNMRTGTKGRSGGVDSKVVDRICALLSCQPGDIMEYIPDE